MVSLDLRGAATAPGPGGEPPRPFAEEARLNAVRLARFDIVLTLPALGISAGLVGLAAWVELNPLAPIFIPLIVAGVRTWRAARRWHDVRRANPVAAIERDAREQARDKSIKEDLELHLAATTPIGSYAIAGALVAVGIVQLITTGARRGMAAAGLVKEAARAGEWWRLVTATFVHSDFGHLLGNVVVLLVLGRMIEAYDRPLRLPLVYLASALAGGAGSMLASDRASIGASGAVIGLAGYTLVIAGRAFGVPELLRKRMWALLGCTALIGAAAFFRIDNGAHLGGVIGGAAVGVLTLPERRVALSPPMDRAGARTMRSRGGPRSSTASAGRPGRPCWPARRSRWRASCCWCDPPVPGGSG